MNGNIPTDNTTLRPWDAVTERDAYIGDQRQEIERLHKLLDAAITERDEAREDAKRATYDAAQETIKVSTVKSHWIEACRERDEALLRLKVADQSLHASLYREGELKKELKTLRETYNDLIGSDRPPLAKKAEIL